MTATVILVAAGSGTRLGAPLPKALVEVAGESLLHHAIRGVHAVPAVAQVVVVAPAAFLEQVRHECHTRYVARGLRVDVVAGGAERTDSVAAGLGVTDPGHQLVLVHDAARCLTPPELYHRVIEALEAGAPAVVPGLPVVDTIKIVDDAGRVTATPDRAGLRAVQTPQGFDAATLRRAHECGLPATDDAGLVESLGVPVLVVTGDPLARKVTTPADLSWAAATLREQQAQQHGRQQGLVG